VHAPGFHVFLGHTLGVQVVLAGQRIPRVSESQARALHSEVVSPPLFAPSLSTILSV